MLRCDSGVWFTIHGSEVRTRWTIAIGCCALTSRRLYFNRLPFTTKEADRRPTQPLLRADIAQFGVGDAEPVRTECERRPPHPLSFDPHRGLALNCGPGLPRAPYGLTPVVKSRICVASLRCSSVKYVEYSPSSRFGLLATAQFHSVPQPVRCSRCALERDLVRAYRHVLRACTLARLRGPGLLLLRGGALPPGGRESRSRRAVRRRVERGWMGKREYRH
jgi:hypothetical protein